MTREEVELIVEEALAKLAPKIREIVREELRATFKVAPANRHRVPPPIIVPLTTDPPAAPSLLPGGGPVKPMLDYPCRHCGLASCHCAELHLHD